MALHCRLLFQIPSWNTFGTRSIRAFALEFQTGLPGYFHFSDETATQLQPPTRPGDARTASNDGDKRTDELCWLLGRRCEALQRCQQIRSLHRATDWVHHDHRGLQQLHKSELTISDKRLICKGGE